MTKRKYQDSTKLTQLTLEIEMSNLQICDPDVAASLCVCPLESEKWNFKERPHTVW